MKEKTSKFMSVKIPMAAAMISCMNWTGLNWRPRTAASMQIRRKLKITVQAPMDSGVEYERVAGMQDMGVVPRPASLDIEIPIVMI